VGKKATVPENNDIIYLDVICFVAKNYPPYYSFGVLGPWSGAPFFSGLSSPANNKLSCA